MAKKIGASGAKSQVGLRPLSDRVVLEALEDTETASGIIIPDTVNQDKSDKGRVVAVGPGRRDESGKLVPVELKVGDKVLFSKYGPDEVEVAGKKYMIVAESSILAVIG